MKIPLSRMMSLVGSTLLLFLFLSCQNPVGFMGQTGAEQSRALASSGGFTANVMAPLHVPDPYTADWAAFDTNLNTVKAYGVDAVSVDVWWGLVEGSADNSFDWSYYDTIFAKIKAANLKIVPILSFHKCGGNAGDTYTSNLPAWIWTKYNGQSLLGLTVGTDDLKYKSSQSNMSDEAITVWADPLVVGQYVEFATAFKNHFAALAGDIQEINVSLGASGELRYPSYNAHDSAVWPYTYGFLQAYSRPAVKDFQNTTMAKYGSLAGVNSAWGKSFATVDGIQPPANASNFYTSGDYKNSKYGQDFLDWYNGSLVKHCKTVLEAVGNALGGFAPTAPIGYKIPGIHWQIAGNSPYPRAAEASGGLIQTSLDFNSDSTGHGYQNIVNLANTVVINGRSILLHFTCLEMPDNAADNYSMAKSLVAWVATAARNNGVTLKGENALHENLGDDYHWNLINDAFNTNTNYAGLTILRMSDVVSGTGKIRYSQFRAAHPNNAGWANLYVRGTNNAWGLTAMTKSGDTWTVKGVTFGGTATERFKFDVKGDWTLNYGGSGLTGTATQNGGDIAVAANSSYDISFNETTKAYAATLVPANNLIVHFSEWESATTYYIHTWNGLTGDFAMQYEGLINNAHWWKVTLPNAPTSFLFCFKNSNNNWDGGNRSFANQAREIYVKARDNMVYTSRP